MSAPVAAGLVCVLSLVSVGSRATLAQGAPSGMSGGRSSEPRSSNARGPQMAWEWWNDAGVQKELGLSTEKIKQIDTFFEKRSKDLRPMAEEWQRQSQELENMTKAAVTDESVYALQVLRVESLGARLRESRTMMLYRIYRVLQPDQYKKLQDILDHRYGRSANNAPGRGRE